MNYVVGSGPSGVSAALALIEAGQPVTMLDAGIRLETERQAALETLQTQRPEQWDRHVLHAFRANTKAQIDGIHLKLAYGSDYPYQHAKQYFLEESDAFKTLVSLAEGGLSTVWGGAMLTPREKDVCTWPINLEDLAPHYRKILSVIPFSARTDDLADRHPLYGDPGPMLKLSRQAHRLLEDLGARRDRLARRGIYFGAARLAVRAEAGKDGHDCAYCGMCLYGCPYQLIYCSAQTLTDLRRHSLFHYYPGVIVDRVAEAGATVRIMARLFPSGKDVQFTGSRVFLAAGVISTARIIMASMETPHALTASTNQHFMFPLLRWSSVPAVTQEALYTLAQLFVELDLAGPPQDAVHLQVYTYNDLMLQALREKIGVFFPAMQPLLNRFLMGRLMIVQGYLHSAHSPKLRMEWRPDRHRLRITAINAPTAHRQIKTTMRTLVKNSIALKALPLSPFVTISQPGIGVHIGATLPMRAHPEGMETDRRGIPRGFSRVHVVDASVLPDLPPTTITLTVMANAHRIAEKAIASSS